jgi:hypothetical protein
MWINTVSGYAQNMLVDIEKWRFSVRKIVRHDKEYFVWSCGVIIQNLHHCSTQVLHLDPYVITT